MAIFVEDCPRCTAKHVTFDCLGETPIAMHHGWQRRYEIFSVCRACKSSTVFVMAQADSDPVRGEQLRLHGPIKVANGGSLNLKMRCESYISIKDRAAINPPEHLPQDVKAAFLEGAKCLAVGCYNAAGTMFRLGIDLATRPMLSTDGSVPYRTRRDLGLRLPWLFANGKLPVELQSLSYAVREEGNDGAHQGTLTEADAQDLLDFAFSLFERMFTEPERLKQRQLRRDARQGKPPPTGP